MARSRDFESLLAEAQAQPFTGWDFSWIKKRVNGHPLPWRYANLVLKHAKNSPDMLDLRTGGGEVLARMSYRPEFTLATEAYPPNVPIAAQRLRPLRVSVIQVGGAPDNNQQISSEPINLPFKDSSFHLVISRHESYVAGEIARILRPHGHSVTQQVGQQRYDDFHQLLNVPVPLDNHPAWDLKLAKVQLEKAGLHIVDSGSRLETKSFRDIGAFAWYLKSVPWSLMSSRSRNTGINCECCTRKSRVMDLSESGARGSGWTQLRGVLVRILQKRVYDVRVNLH